MGSEKTQRRKRSRKKATNLREKTMVLLTSKNLPLKGYLNRLLNNKNRSMLGSTSKNLKTVFRPNLTTRRAAYNQLTQPQKNYYNRKKRMLLNNYESEWLHHNSIMNNIREYNRVVLRPVLPNGRNTNYHRNMYNHLIKMYNPRINVRNLNAYSLREAQNSVFEHYMFNRNYNQ